MPPPHQIALIDFKIEHRSLPTEKTNQKFFPTKVNSICSRKASSMIKISSATVCASAHRNAMTIQLTRTHSLLFTVRLYWYVCKTEPAKKRPFRKHESGVIGQTNDKLISAHWATTQTGGRSFMHSAFSPVGWVPIFSSFFWAHLVTTLLSIHNQCTLRYLSINQCSSSMRMTLQGNRSITGAEVFQCRSQLTTDLPRNFRQSSPSDFAFWPTHTILSGVIACQLHYLQSK